ncbi:GyrI-like domain-containing protein [Legionella sp.]|uniref:GyrI-like domain-containing protein n=1 Tax=Legionella sp. TaxID=459 RepID=UPI003C8ADD9E
MSSIPPTLKYVEGFTVMGLSTKTQNTDEFNEKTAKLPNLWQQFYSSDLAANTNIFEVYSDYESDANGLYTVTVGISDDSEHAEFGSVKIQTGNYLVFHGTGPMPSTVVETWKQIWDYFEEKSNYQRSFISDFEAYNGSDKVAIYIGINEV